MPIVETRKYSKPTADVRFYHEGSTDIRNTFLAAVQPLKDNGKLSTNISVVDNTVTITTTHADLATWSSYDTAVGTDYDNEFLQHYAANGINFISYEVTGIDNPFTMTTVYTNTNNWNGFTDFQRMMAALPNSKLVSMTAAGNTFTMVHTFDNGTDYTNNYVSDYSYCNLLASNGVTRAVTYS